MKKDRMLTQAYAAWVAKDWLVLPTTGIVLKNVSRTVYAGEGMKYGNDAPAGWENKTYLQRIALQLSANRDVQRELEEAAKSR